LRFSRVIDTIYLVIIASCYLLRTNSTKK